MTTVEKLEHTISLIDKYPVHFQNAEEAAKLPPLPQGYQHSYLEFYLGNEVEEPYCTVIQGKVFLSDKAQQSETEIAVQIFDADGNPCLIAVEGVTLIHRLQQAPLPPNLFNSILDGETHRLKLIERLITTME